jgi:hypothetical protein
MCMDVDAKTVIGIGTCETVWKHLWYVCINLHKLFV